MNTIRKSKLSFFEAIYIWIYIYTTKSRFLTGRGTAEGSASASLAFLQTMNLLFFMRVFFILFKVEITYLSWIILVSLVGFIIFNVIKYENNIDSIAERHNDLSEKERLSNRLKMWIYVALTCLSIIGLGICASLQRESTKVESMRDKLRIEIQNRGGLP